MTNDAIPAADLHNADLRDHSPEGATHSRARETFGRLHWTWLLDPIGGTNVRFFAPLPL